jgi:RimJ/RimL family protein N-acetyltransferase
VGPVWLIWPHRTSLLPPGIENAKANQRFEFYQYDSNSEVLDKLRRQLPEDCAIQLIDRQLLERCEWRSEMEFYAGSMSNFLEHGIGLCMMRDGEILVEACASSLGKSRAEIGAITRENYRGRGYAGIACAYLIQICENKGYQAYWSCDADHQASIRVAQKLGFRQTRAYQVYEYDSL